MTIPIPPDGGGYLGTESQVSQPSGGQPGSIKAPLPTDRQLVRPSGHPVDRISSPLQHPSCDSPGGCGPPPASQRPSSDLSDSPSSVLLHPQRATATPHTTAKRPASGTARISSARSAADQRPSGLSLGPAPQPWNGPVSWSSFFCSRPSVPGAGNPQRTTFSSQSRTPIWRIRGCRRRGEYY